MELDVCTLSQMKAFRAMDIMYRFNNGRFEGVIQKQQQLNVAEDKDLARKAAQIKDIVNLHCLQILYLNIYVLTDIYLKPPKSIDALFAHSFADMRRAAKTWSCQTLRFPAEVKQGGILPSCFSSHTVSLLNVIQGSSVVRASAGFNTDESGLFYKDFSE